MSAMQDHQIDLRRVYESRNRAGRLGPALTQVTHDRHIASAQYVGRNTMPNCVAPLKRHTSIWFNATT